MSTIANAKVEHNYNCYNGYFFGCLLIKSKRLLQKKKRNPQLSSKITFHFYRLKAKRLSQNRDSLSCYNQVLKN